MKALYKKLVDSDIVCVLNIKPPVILYKDGAAELIDINEMISLITNNIILTYGGANYYLNPDEREWIL